MIKHKIFIKMEGEERETTLLDWRNNATQNPVFLCTNTYCALLGDKNIYKYLEEYFIWKDFGGKNP